LARQNQIRTNLRERGEDEAPLAEARMGKREAFGSDFAISCVEKVEVDGARDIASGASGASEPFLTSAQIAEESDRIAGQLGLDDCVEERVGAGRAIDWTRDIDARDEDRRGE
jgi:hypothetical protein